MILESLHLLAADCTLQEAVLPSFVHVPDEVALIFYDSFLLADQIVEAGLLSEAEILRLKEVDQILDRMSDEKALWTHESLCNDRMWTSVRQMAAESLRLLGVEPRPPNLSWLTFVKGRDDNN